MKPQICNVSAGGLSDLEVTVPPSGAVAGPRNAGSTEWIDLSRDQAALRSLHGPRCHRSSQYLSDAAKLWGIGWPDPSVNEHGVFKHFDS